MTATITKLDLGAGNATHDTTWTTLDIVATFRPDVLGDAHRLPYKDESLSAIKCHHVLEHIPRDYFVFHFEPKEYIRGKVVDNIYLPPIHAGSQSYIESRKGLVDVMNEIWRVLKPAGELWIEVPLFPSEDAVGDPTHGSFLTSGTFDYFNRCDEHSDEILHMQKCVDEQRRMYGIKPWRITRRERVNHARSLVVLLSKLDDEVVETPCTEVEHLWIDSRTHSRPDAGQVCIHCKGER